MKKTEKEGSFLIISPFSAKNTDNKIGIQSTDPSNKKDINLAIFFILEALLSSCWDSLFNYTPYCFSLL